MTNVKRKRVRERFEGMILTDTEGQPFVRNAKNQALRLNGKIWLPGDRVRVTVERVDADGATIEAEQAVDLAEAALLRRAIEEHTAACPKCKPRATVNARRSETDCDRLAALKAELGKLEGK